MISGALIIIIMKYMPEGIVGLIARTGGTEVFSSKP